MSCSFAIKPREYSITNTQTPTLEHRYRTKKDRKKNKNFVKPNDPELDHSIYDESGKKLIERETMKFCTNFKKLLENNGVVYMIELDSIHNGVFDTYWYVVQPCHSFPTALGREKYSNIPTHSYL